MKLDTPPNAAFVMVYAVSAAIIGFVTGCSTGVIGGKPQLPLSDKGGTTRLFEATQDQAVSAITNAFAGFSYRGMVLREMAESERVPPSGDTRNRFVLWAMHEPIAKVPLDSAKTKWVPYVADFLIVVMPLGSNQTHIAVRTISSEVIDGREAGIHTEWANRYRRVPPVRQEEENVLSAISEELFRSIGVK
jgi:hypothetical protein